MSKKNVKINLSMNLDTRSGSLNPWDVAISEAERKIQEAKKRVRQLRGQS